MNDAPRPGPAPPPSPRPPHDEEERPVEVTNVQARQGVTLGRMRWVLAGGLVAVIILFLIVGASWAS